MTPFLAEIKKCSDEAECYLLVRSALVEPMLALSDELFAAAFTVEQTLGARDHRFRRVTAFNFWHNRMKLDLRHAFSENKHLPVALMSLLQNLALVDADIDNYVADDHSSRGDDST